MLLKTYLCHFQLQHVSTLARKARKPCWHVARDHMSTQGTLAREHLSTQGTLAREYVSTQGTLAHEHVSRQGTLACEHVSTQFSRLTFFVLQYHFCCCFLLEIEGVLFFLRVQSCNLKKTLINDRLRVSKVSRKFRTPTIYNFAVICP